MSSSTLSSTSGLSDRISNSKRALSDNEELDERTIKRTRTAPDDQHNGKRDAKEKKKRQKKKKKKHSVVTVEDGRARVKDSRRGVSSFLDTTDVEDMILPVKAGESSTTLSKISVPTTGSMDSLLEEHDVEQIVSFSKVSCPRNPVTRTISLYTHLRIKGKERQPIPRSLRLKHSQAHHVLNLQKSKWLASLRNYLLRTR